MKPSYSKFILVGLVLVLIALGVGVYYWYSDDTLSVKEVGNTFAIPELDIVLELPEDKNDLVYELHSGESGMSAYLSSKSLISMEEATGEKGGYCTSKYFPLGAISSKDGILSYEGPQATCGTNEAVNAHQSSYLSSIRAAVDAANSTVAAPADSQAEVLYNELYPNTRREVLQRQEIKSWTHKNGVRVTLYEKDRFINEDESGTETSMQQLLVAKTSSGMEYTLLNKESWNVWIGNGGIENIAFSPLGNYVVVTGSGYEAPFAATFNLNNGEEEFPGLSMLYSFAEPYWNEDESRLAVIRPTVSIDGTIAAVFYSSTGKPEDLKLIKDFWVEKPATADPYLADVSRSGDILTLTFWIDRKMWSGGPYDIDQIYTFNLDSGSLVLKETLQR